MDKRDVPPDSFCELARLAHDSFVNRQVHEWRFCFSLWTAMGLVVWFAVSEHVVILRDRTDATVAILLLFVISALNGRLSSKAHCIDKAFKHYYMDLAEGRPSERPSPRRIQVSRMQATWALSQALVTVGIGLLAVQMLLRVAEVDEANEVRGSAAFAALDLPGE